MSPFSLLSSALVSAGAIVAIAFDFAPQRIDLLTALLTGAGIGGLIGSLLGEMRDMKRPQRGDFVEYCLVRGALGAGIAWALGALLQEVF